MLQQTRVETVIPYYLRFLKRFPTVRALSQAAQSDVLKLWEGLGYYARARNLHRAAQAMTRWPKSAEEWSSLPGVGEYTAAAVASITRGEPVAVVDGNVRRVVARILNEGRLSPDKLREYLRQSIDPRAPGDFNQGIMELGQVICSPRSPRCAECPVRRHCGAFAAGSIDRVPARDSKKKVPHFEIAIGVCRKRDRILISRRKENGLLGGLWEFPGGKIHVGESAARAVAREFREEVGIDVEVDREFIVVPHRYSHFSVRLHTFHCRHRAGRARAIDSAEVRWVRFPELKKLAFPTANRKIIAALDR